MRVFARDPVLARSKFWFHMKRQHKVRKVQGEIISTSEIFERRTGSIKNYGIVLRYLTRTNTVNMYKEYRDVSLAGAVSQMYMEMSGRHSARAESIQIIKTAVLHEKQIKRPQTLQFNEKKIQFPQMHRLKRAPTLALRTTYKANRPTLI
jgi:large subunit ribosomal protein L18Ae